MPVYHARANAIRAIKTELGITHTEAAKVMSDPRREQLCFYIGTWDLTTHAEAVAMAEDPANQILCGECGWTKGMTCPECPGCGCYTGQCTGWRHAEYDGEAERGGEEDRCPECGDDGLTYDCSCFNPTPSHCRECGASWRYGCDC